ncbi:MAG: patatin-like phospholipase family protein [Prevotellaceae bacterium]|nr:patatin-like phospholipase family protein [Prevotellaceae bacterium]
MVFSGGGAKGLVYLGALKALEENNIPVDCITGTSIGGVIGGMYASGYSIDEIIEYIKSDDFKHWSTGEYESEFSYYYKKLDKDAEMIGLKFNIDSNFHFKMSLPTNLIQPYQMDMAILKIFAQPSAACGGDFNRLMLPFRALSFDAYDKRPYSPRHGDLGTVIRASMSFPGVFKPAVIDTMLLFDGGMINNFPVDVAIQEFNPDFILGLNCSYNYDRPTEDDVFSYITSLTSSSTIYSVPDNKGFVIDFDSLGVGLMDFYEVDRLCAVGYERTMGYIPQIKEWVLRERSGEELDAMREEFRKKWPPLEFKNVMIQGGTRNVRSYMTEEIQNFDTSSFTFDEMRDRYFEIVSDDGILTFVPTAVYNSVDSAFDLNIRFSRAPNMRLSLGGQFSSFTNMAFLGLQYTRYAPVSIHALGNFYFGSVYNSQKLQARFDTKWRYFKLPVFAEAIMTHGAYDFYSKNPDLIYEDTRPDFMKDNEVFFRVNLGIPFFGNGVLKLGESIGLRKSNYYTTKNFTTIDIPEDMNFNFVLTRLFYRSNTLNYKTFATEGTERTISLGYAWGKEYHKPGTTSEIYAIDSVLPEERSFVGNHRFFQFKFSQIQHFRIKKHISIGYRIDVVLSQQVKFKDYYGTLLFLPLYEPMPNVFGLFLENYRSSAYVAIGIIPAYTFFERLQIRAETYLYQPFVQLSTSNTFESLAPLYKDGKRTFHLMGSLSAVLQTGIGPFSAGLTFYEKSGTQLFFSVKFGFYLLNRRAFD